MKTDPKGLSPKKALPSTSFSNSPRHKKKTGIRQARRIDNSKSNFMHFSYFCVVFLGRVYEAQVGGGTCIILWGGRSVDHSYLVNFFHNRAA